MRQFSLSNHYTKAALMLGAAFLLYACEEANTEKLGELNRNFASRVIQNATVTYKDSGYVRFELKAPMIEEFSFIDSPYTVMRKGLKIHFWKINSNKANFIKADWAKINNIKNTYEGKGNIVMINTQGDTLRTQKIFWNRIDKKILTKDTVIISRIDGTKITANNGLEGNEDFTEFTLFQNRGFINLKEEKSKSSTPISSTEIPTSQKSTPPKTDKNPIPLHPKEKEPQ